jgi:hypothetical protein
MSSSIFSDKTIEPTDALFCEAVGPTYKYWQELEDYLHKNYGEIKKEWKFYGQKIGWQLKTFLKKRNLFFTIPQDGHFRIAFALGEKAVIEVEKSDLPANLIQTLLNARKYAEGRGLSIEVKESVDIQNVKKLVDIKLKK